MQSSQTTFSPGALYHFLVANEGKAVQEFLIIPSAVAPSATHTNALAMIDTVPVGATKTVDYAFPSSMVGQSLEFACYLHGQYEVGMQLPITVSSEQTRRHASYNVAKKVLGFVYQVAIPRTHLRAAYADGFRGAPIDGKLAADRRFIPTGSRSFL